MQTQSDAQLLREYAEQRSDPAFAEILARHTDLVYSAAWRQTGSPELAREVAQSVFTDLARKARALTRQLKEDASLVGWLYRGTRYAGLTLLRDERRRQAHERQVMEHFNPAPETAPDWERVGPVLDEAMAELGDADREAVLLRFFKNEDFHAVGRALGVSDDAAQKRVSRAVERLREFLAKRGVTVGASGLVLVISANSVQAAPIGLVVSLTTAAVKGTAAATTTLTPIEALKLMAWTKIKTSIAVSVGALLIVGTAALVTMSATGVFQPSGKYIPGSRLRLPVGPGTPVISMGATHGLILASDGSLWSWGEDWAGWPVLGLGNVATQTTLHRIGQETDWVNIASSFAHSLAVKSDGTLWAWGENIHYQLGDGTKTMWRTPFYSVAGNDWKQVAAGGAASFARKRDGTLWSWGDNWAGNLGIGSTIESREAVQIGSQTNWTKVWAGGVQTVGLQSDGSLWFWGTLTGEKTNLFLVPTRVSADTNWVDVGFGFFTIFAIKADGTLWVWGRNAGVYTGRPIQLLNETPVQVGTNNDWQACSSAEYYYRVLKKKDGSLWSLDASDYAFVNKASYKPVELRRINLQKDVVAFGAAGRDVMGVALTREGEVWTWGKVLGEHIPAHTNLQSLAKRIGWETDRFESKPVMRAKPWQLPNSE